MFLVTGGAGYIGSITTKLFLDRGASVVVLDDLSHGFRGAIDSRAVFIEGSIDNRSLLKELFKSHPIKGIVHFAGFIEVAESVANPTAYYLNNVARSLVLLEEATLAGIKKWVFSSTAAVYGEPKYTPIDENHPSQPVNPYGDSKRMFELCLRDACRANQLDAIALRYFNVAGACRSTLLGEAHEPESHLIPRLLKSALSSEASAKIFGDDYATQDGTCVRDYIHVEDLAEAHWAAVQCQYSPARFEAINLGSDKGYSVREVIQAVEQVTKTKMKVSVEARRAGDPAVLVASNQKAKALLQWTPKHGLLEMIEDAHRWHSKRPKGYHEIGRAHV